MTDKTIMPQQLQINDDIEEYKNTMRNACQRMTQRTKLEDDTKVYKGIIGLILFDGVERAREILEEMEAKQDALIRDQKK